MPAHISIKKAIIFLLCGIICAAGTAFLVNLYLAGPKLGKVYDFFLGYRSAPTISHEILIINTDEFAQSGDIFSALMTMTEMEAANLLLSARVSGSSSPVSGTESEIRRRFYEEYVLLGNNIRNLFDAIRIGSVGPAQAPVYVDRLVEMSEQSKERLLSVLVDRDEQLVRSAAVFGNYLEIELKPVFDQDGKLRRVQPIESESSLEHPVYYSLKHRYVTSHIEESDLGRILVFKAYNGDEWEIPLDRNGNILTVGKGGDFRNIDVIVFREYDVKDHALYQAMKEADEIGCFTQVMPERSPLFLYEYAYVLREELLKAPDSEMRTAWIEAREAYFQAMEEFLNGPSEKVLVSGYENVIANEKNLKEEGLLKLAGMRDGIIKSFTDMRQHYKELKKIRDELKSELASSYCILGPKENTEYSALLANSIITGSHIKPSYYLYALYWTASISLIILLVIFRLRPILLLLAGVGLSLFAACVFGAIFIFTSYWIDPTIVFVSAFAGTMVMFCCKCVILSSRARRFKAAYGSSVSRKVLKDLIGRGKPEINETTVATAAVIAIRDFSVLNKEDKEKSVEAGKAQKTFYTTVRNIIFNAGAVIAGYHGDTIIACFGSPLDNDAAFTRSPAAKAYSFVKELLKNEAYSSWRFGIDSGKCTFSWSPESGFTANGRPVVRAKILASKNARFNTRALVSDSIREDTNLNIKQIGSLHNDTDAFYELAL